MRRFVQHPFTFYKRIIYNSIDFIAGFKQGIHDLIVRLFEVFEQLAGQFRIAIVVSTHHLFQRIGGFAHRRNDDDEFFLPESLQNGSYIFDGIGVFDGGPAEFENFERFFHLVKPYLL